MLKVLLLLYAIKVLLWYIDKIHNTEKHVAMIKKIIIRCIDEIHNTFQNLVICVLSRINSQLRKNAAS